jgi:uncharacterized protein
MKRSAIRFAVMGSLHAAACCVCNGQDTPPAGARDVGTALSRCLADNRPYKYTPAVDADLRGPDPAVTDLMRALSGGHVAHACGLIAAGAKVNAADRDGTTALSIAVAQGEAGVVGALLAAGADPNTADRNGATPMCSATEFGSPTIVNELLKAGADVNRPDEAGVTPLMCASAHNQAVVGILLARGADANARTENGRTALMGAGGAEAAKLLIRSGADVNAVDKQGNTALSLATHFGRGEVARILRRAGARR